MFEFPKDEKRRKAWTAKVKRKDFVPSSTSRLCAKHFTNDQFVVDPILAMSVGYKVKKLQLKPTAEPALFNFAKEKQTEGEELTKRKIRQSGAVAKRQRIEVKNFEFSDIELKFIYSLFILVLLSL